MKVATADTLTIEPPMTTVIDRGRCVGFLLARGPVGVEAFDGNEFSLGLFPDEHAAVAAEKAKRTKPPRVGAETGGTP
jgi:hypothetical protein